MTDQSNPSTDLFTSKLSDGRQRFLSHAVQHALAVGRRTPRDFIRHFPPETIMEGMANQAELRASILSQTTGLKARIASKKTWQAAAEDLRIALTEGETTADTIMAVFDPDDRIRYLDPKALWAFLVEGDFWAVSPTKVEEHRIARQHVAYLLDRGLYDGLLTHRTMVEGITVAEIASRLPKAELGKIIDGALVAGKKRAPFTEVELWAAIPASVLVEYVPLSHLWNSVIHPRIAEVHGYSANRISSSEPPITKPPAPEPKSSEVSRSAPPPPPPPPTPVPEVVSEDDFA
jgi:hypothetical protein